MKNIISKIQYSNFISFIPILIFYLVFGLQGLSIGDEGFVVCGYQQIFNDPESVQFLFPYYLTILIGGVWNSVFGFLGFYSFRILAAITVTLTCYMVYLLAKDIVNKKGFFLGTYLYIAYTTLEPKVFSYGTSTLLLGVLGLLFLYRGYLREKSILLFISGIILGVNIFCRLPNVVLLGTIIFIIPANYFADKNYKKTILDIIVFIAGCVLGCYVILLLMHLLNHYTIFVNSLYDLSKAGSDSESAHNLFSLAKVYAKDYLMIFRSSVFIFSLPLLVVCKYKQRFLSSRYISAFVIVILSLLLLGHDWLSGYFLVSLCTCVLLYVIISNYDDRNKLSLSLLSLIFLYAFPLGSSGGFYTASTGLRVATPIAVGLLFDILEKNKHQSNLLRYYFITLISLSTIVGFCVNIRHNTFYEKSPRWSMLYKSENNLASVYLSKENVTKLDELLCELKKYVRKNDYLLCYEHLPYINYLTETRPCFNNPYIWAYEPTSLKKHIEQWTYDNKELPVVVANMAEAQLWSVFNENWNRTDAENTVVHNNQRIGILNDFISKNHYTEVWHNEVFIIYVPINYGRASN